MTLGPALGRLQFGDAFVGFSDGWKGLVEDKTQELNVRTCRGILPRGGTILGTSRTNPYKKAETVDKLIETFKRLELVDQLNLIIARHFPGCLPEPK